MTKSVTQLGQTYRWKSRNVLDRTPSTERNILPWLKSNNPDFLTSYKQNKNFRIALISANLSVTIFTRVLNNHCVLSIDEFLKVCKAIGADPFDIINWKK